MKPRFSGVLELSERFLDHFREIFVEFHHFEGNVSTFFAKKDKFEDFVFTFFILKTYGP